jgi:hypothetical protein
MEAASPSTGSDSSMPYGNDPHGLYTSPEETGPIDSIPPTDGESTAAGDGVDPEQREPEA